MGRTTAVLGMTLGFLGGTVAIGASALAAAPPSCVYTVSAGQSLTIIANELATPGVTAESLQAENGIVDADVINIGQVLDVCVGNGIDDRTGTAVVTPDTSPVGAQQARLNALLTPVGFRPLKVDGVSGPLTRQALCAARLLTGLPVSRADLAPGSDEEAWIMAAPLVTPTTAAADQPRWVLVDQTCQVLVAGEGPTIRFVFPTSTGVDRYPTRTLDRARAFRYDPATDNGGWHNSTTFPAAVDNPLNGNMYKPVYFSRGQAIHGANNVPPQPASHGCVRLRVGDQDQLVAWLGLADVSRPLWDDDRLQLVVTTQGDYAVG